MKIRGRFIFILIAFLIFFYFGERFYLNNSGDETCSKDTVHLVESIHIGMDVNDVIKIIENRMISYSVWKDEVELKINAKEEIPFSSEIVIVAENRGNFFVGRKEIIILNIEDKKVSRRICKVILTGL